MKDFWPSGTVTRSHPLSTRSSTSTAFEGLKSNSTPVEVKFSTRLNRFPSEKLGFATVSITSRPMRVTILPNLN